MDKNIIGPALPPGFERATSEEPSSSLEGTNDSQSEQESISEYYGPLLPPHLKNKDNLKSTCVNEDKDEDSPDDVYGPMPANQKNSSEAQIALEKRALEIKLGYTQTDTSNITDREEWMTQLPEIGKNLGLGARQFRKNPTADFSDRSSWTDTPTNKERKKAKADSFKEVEVQERDKEQGKIAEKFNKKRKKDKSLYEMHQDELKKKKKKETESSTSTRRPFNREIDLKVNQFDEAQKKSILKKAQHLDDRFSQGQAKFL